MKCEALGNQFSGIFLRMSVIRPGKSRKIGLSKKSRAQASDWSKKHMALEFAATSCSEVLFVNPADSTFSTLQKFLFVIISCRSDTQSADKAKREDELASGVSRL